MKAVRLVRELSWLAPFLVLGLAALVLERSWPVFPTPARYRIVTDASGKEVKVPDPLRGVTPGWFVNQFLEFTHVPDALFRVGGPKGRADYARSLYGRIYSQIAAKDVLWTVPGDIESQLAAGCAQTLHGGTKRTCGTCPGISSPAGRHVDGTANFSGGVEGGRQIPRTRGS